MPILHAFAALIAGFLVMVALVAVVTALLTRFAPTMLVTDAPPRPIGVLFNLTWTFLAAMAGGFITTRLATTRPLTYALTLAIIMLLLGALSALQQRRMQPIWYQLLLVALAPIGVFCGAILELHHTGLL